MENQQLLDYLEYFITEERKHRFEEIIQNRTNHFSVALEDLFQMHNASAVIRSCDVFGVQTAHFIEQKYAKRLDKNIAMGAQKWVTTKSYTSTKDCIQNLKEKGYQIVATTPNPQAVSLEDFDISQKSVFFFGTEKKGLSEVVLDQADSFLTIPMVGFSESLNISVSVAVILQNVCTRLRQSQVDWALSEEDILQTKIQWTKNSVRSLDFLLKRFYQMNPHFLNKPNK